MTFEMITGFPLFVAKENEGDPAPSPEPAPESNPAPEGTGDSTPMFTQEQVNEIVVKRNKKVRSQLESTEKQYEQLLSSSSLTAKEKVELQGRLEELQGQLRTKEQQAAYEAKKAAEAHQSALENASAERDHYKGLFETQTRDNAIMAAASNHDAYNPQQFIDIVGPRTKIVEEVNEHGEKTGRLVPRVEVTVKGDDGTPAVVLKTPDEAIADLKIDVSNFGNLFRGNVAKGIGEGSNANISGTQRVDVSKMTDAEYFANREAIQKQYGIRQRRDF